MFGLQELIITFIVCGLWGLLPAFIARYKGRSFVKWWIYGIFLFFIALIHSLVISKSIQAKENELKANGYKECPFCREMVKSGATVCPHCRRDLPEDF